MLKRIAYVGLTAAMAGGIALGTGGAASAAHCAEEGGPGNSDYASHVQATNGPGAHNEGDHQGYSSCNENSKNYVP